MKNIIGSDFFYEEYTDSENITNTLYLEIPFDKNISDNLDSIVGGEANTFFKGYPVVYIIRDDKEAYIGETTNLIARMKDHISNPIRKSFNKVIIIGNKLFNKSAIYNIETNLINSFIGDERYGLQNRSQTKNRVMHNYHNKSYYHKTIFELLWAQLLVNGIVNSSLQEITNKDIFKFSPFKELSESQYELKQYLIKFCEKETQGTKVCIIEGDAGSGKSVLLSSFFNTIQDLSKDKTSINLRNKKNYLLVNNSEILKTYKALGRILPSMNVGDFMKPTSFLTKMRNSGEIADLVVIDEAHLLLTQADSYNNFKENNHLNEIMRYAKKVIVVFDERQVLKVKSYWNKKDMFSIIKGIDKRPAHFKLTEQFRMNASDELIDWIESFLNKYLVDIPKDIYDGKYEFEVFDNMKDMHDLIKIKNNLHKLSRMVATFDYEHKKSGGKYYVKEEEYKIPWNTTLSNQAWAERNTVNEIGSIYTIQGFDLNYVGVVIGPSIKYDEINDKIIIDVDVYKDTEAFRSASKFDVKGSGINSKKVKEEIILNSLNILLKRGVHGLYIYASDDKLRKRLMELYNKSRKIK